MRWLLSPATSLALLALAATANAQELSFGSKPDETAEGGLVLFVAQLKGRSHFGFSEHGSREGEPAFVEDLGVTSTQLAPGLRAAVGVGRFGWVGGELLGFEERDSVALLGRLRSLSGVTLAPGDVVESSTRALWGGVHYGWDLRLKVWEIEFAAGPTFGFGFFHLDESAQRIFLEPSAQLGGDATAFVLAPGFHFEAELFELVRAGAELEEGLTGLRFAVSTPHVNLWERIRVYAGVTVFALVDFTVGWRLQAVHLLGDGRAMDVRLDGVDFTLGVRF